MDGTQAVVIGEKVYMGGGFTEEIEDSYHVFQYNTSLNEWSRLPKHPVHRFAMAQFMGSLITVGGEGAVGGVDITDRTSRTILLPVITSVWSVECGGGEGFGRGT